MRKSVALATVAIAVLASGEARANRGAVGIEQTTRFVLELERTRLAIPQILLPGDRGRHDHTSVRLGFEAAALDSMIGPDLALTLGFVPNEASSVHRGFPLALDGRLGGLLPLLKWRGAFSGVVAFLLATEVGLGGGTWWSDGPRLSFMGGVRILSASKNDVRFDVNYLLVPFIFASSPEGFDVHRIEHRLSLVANVTPLRNRPETIGVGISFKWVDQTIRLDDTLGVFGAGASTTGVTMELRL